jgi:hypothetical protein
MLLRFLLGGALSFLAPTYLAAAPATFEGTVQLNISGGARLVRSMTFQTRADQARIITLGEAGKTATLIMDYKNAKMTIMMPAQHMYMVRPLSLPEAPSTPRNPTDDAAAPAAPALEKEAATDTILGYLCNKYVLHAQGITTVIWATDELGSFSALGRGNFGPQRPGRAALPQGWQKAVAGKNFFPLRVVATDANGVEKFRMEVTGVTKEKLPDEDFVPPPGYQQFDPTRMMPH